MYPIEGQFLWRDLGDHNLWIWNHSLANLCFAQRPKNQRRQNDKTSNHRHENKKKYTKTRETMFAASDVT